MSRLEGFPFVVASLIRKWLDVGSRYDGVHYIGCGCVTGTSTWVCVAVDDILDLLVPLYHFHGFQEVWGEILRNCLKSLDAANNDVNISEHDICLLIDVLAFTFVENMINSMDRLDEHGFGYTRCLVSGRQRRFGFPDPRIFYSWNDVDSGCPFPWHYAPVA